MLLKQKRMVCAIQSLIVTVEITTKGKASNISVVERYKTEKVGALTEVSLGASLVVNPSLTVALGWAQESKLLCITWIMARKSPLVRLCKARSTIEQIGDNALVGSGSWGRGNVSTVSFASTG